MSEDPMPGDYVGVGQFGGLRRSFGQSTGQALLCGGVLCADFRFPGGPFHFAHFVFDHALQVKCDLSKLGHHFAHGSREARQFLRSKNDECHDKQKGEMGQTEHRGT